MFKFIKEVIRTLSAPNPAREFNVACNKIEEELDAWREGVENLKHPNDRKPPAPKNRPS